MVTHFKGRPGMRVVDAPTTSCGKRGGDLKLTIIILEVTCLSCTEWLYRNGHVHPPVVLRRSPGLMRWRNIAAADACVLDFPGCHGAQ